MKKICCLILALLMMIPLLAACKKEPGKENTSDTEAKEIEWLVPVEDLEGREFKILGTASNYGLTLLDIEEPASSLEQSIYARNRDLEERLNIVINYTEAMYDASAGSALKEEIRTQYYANQAAHDLYVGSGNVIISLSTEGCYAEVSELGTSIDLTKSWWDESSMENLYISGKSYALAGKALLHYYESTNIMAYNVDYAASMQMPNFAEMALEGNWTWEDVHTYSEMAWGDLDNDSSKDASDLLGFTVGHNLIEIALISSGEDVLTYDDNNYPSFSGFSERTIDVYDDIVKWFYTSEDTLIAPRDNQLLSDAGVASWHDLFSNGKALFYMEPVGSLQKLRESDFEFTVLPAPKYEADDEYRTNIVRYASLMFVPSLATEKEEIGLFLENLMYASSIKTFPDYVETIVNLQRTRNVLSYRVLTEIVWASETVISMLHLYDFGELSTTMVEYAKEGKKINALGVSMARNLDSLIEQALGAKPSN